LNGFQLIGCLVSSAVIMLLLDFVVTVRTGAGAIVFLLILAVHVIVWSRVSILLAMRRFKRNA